jgi:environmental stress-induced protein Ves
MRIQRTADYPAIPWKNGLGVSRVIASNPDAAAYDAAIWQVGSTDIGIDCPFSSLPGMDRQFMLLAGAGVELRCVDVVAGVDVRHAVKEPFNPVAFRGEWQTTCKLFDDPVQVLNVMTRRGRAGAKLTLPRWMGPLLLEQRAGETVIAVLLTGAAQVVGDAAPLLPLESVVLDVPGGEMRSVVTIGGVARMAVVRLTLQEAHANTSSRAR